MDDEAEALHILEHHNYYRISAYRFPFELAKDRFKDGTTFKQLWELYCFDRGLRKLITEACKKVEISVRARWAHVLAERHGPQSYEDLEVFCDLTAKEKKKEKAARFHMDNLLSLDRELSRSKEVFVTHYRYEKQILRPPIWVVSESMTFGLLSRFYDGIARDSDKKAIAKTYDLSVDGLRSTLQRTVYIRNLCAHHSRLWNRKLTVNMSLPNSRPKTILSSLNPQEPKLLYNSIILLGHMTSIIEPGWDWKARIRQHLEQLNPELLPSMGYPSDWRERLFWKSA
ncbi:MAG TPA: Abi family protein [Opitutales bacterium]|nr:Abi family protein [Opitutales bacterium]